MGTVKTASEEQVIEQVSRAMKKYKGRTGVLIEALQEAQHIAGHLSRKVMIRVAEELTVPLSEVYSVVSFYSLFSTSPMGRYRLEVCMGTACYVKGAEKLLQALKNKLGVDTGTVTDDGMFSLATTRCVGACSTAPVLKVGDDLHGHLTAEQLDSLLRS